MVAVGVVPIVIAAAVTVYVVRDSHRDDVAKLESAVLTEKASEIQNFIDQSLLGQARVLIPSGPNLGIATSAQEFVLSETLQNLPFVRSESYINLNGQQTSFADADHPTGDASSSDLQDMSTSPQFLAVKNGASYYLGPVTYVNDAYQHDPIITFASPVKDSSGKLIAIVSGQASLEPLIPIIAPSGLIGNTGYIYLVDQDGVVIGGGKNFALLQQGFSSMQNTSIVRSVLAGTPSLTADTQMSYTSAFGAPVVAAAFPMPEYQSKWGLIAEWPTAEANAVINSLLLRDLLILIGVLILIIILSILAALFIVKPIKKLEEGTRRVAEGKFNEGVNIKTGDELEDLGDSFNQMVQGLKQLEQLKDEFVFIAAHELKTPVAAMKGYLSLILDGTTGTISDGTRSFIEKVVASDNRLVQLVNDLLEVARSQAGKLTIKVVPIDIAPPIQSTLEELKSLADEKSVAMIYQPENNLPKVFADGDRIKEVMVNLVGNAIKYMGDGTAGNGADGSATQKTITIMHERKDNMLITHIKDTGLGMSKEAQEKLFTKFYRVATEKTRDIQGTGLGLFIVKEIIEKMNGTIWVESEEGKGSTFSFSLMLA